jgi:hypothetical protein
VYVYFEISSHKRLNSRSIDGFKGWGRLILRDGWKCTFACVPSVYFTQKIHSTDAILGACDVEGNFLAIKVC